MQARPKPGGDYPVILMLLAIEILLIAIMFELGIIIYILTGQLD